MTNADRFQQVFGLYATEVWAFSEKEFLKWINEEPPELTVKALTKGKWLPDNNNYYEERFICSVCGKSYKVDTCMGKPMWDFCPCGADMRSEQDGES